MNKIICGDSREVLPSIPASSISTIFTSPPYASTPKYDVCKEIKVEEYIEWFLTFLDPFYNSLKEGGALIINIGDKVENGFRSTYVFDLVCQIVKNSPFKLYERFIWNKGKYLPNKYRFGNSFEYVFWFSKGKPSTVNLDDVRQPYDEKSLTRMKNKIKKRLCRTKENQQKQEYKEWSPNPLGALPNTIVNIGSETKMISDKHFAVFPVKLADFFIKASSNENDLICDPFNGTGTTCLSAKNLKRQYFGIDISPDYCDIASNRLTAQ